MQREKKGGEYNEGFTWREKKTLANWIREPHNSKQKLARAILLRRVHVQACVRFERASQPLSGRFELQRSHLLLYLTCDTSSSCFKPDTCGSDGQDWCTNNIVRNRCRFGLRCQEARCLPFPPKTPANTGAQETGSPPTSQPANPANTPPNVVLPVVGIPGSPLASGFISGSGIVQVGEKGSAANVGYGETISTKLNGGAARVSGRESLSGRSDGGGSGQTSLTGATEVLPGDGGVSRSTGSSQNGFIWNTGKGTGLAENRVTLDSRPDQASGETLLRTLSVGLKGAGSSSQFSLKTLDP